MDLTKHLERCIIAADLGISKLFTDIYYLDGMSSPKGRRLLNLLCELPECHYCEVGSWKGSTLVSALYENNNIGVAVAIDNFSEFQEPLFTNSINFDGSPLKNDKIPLSIEPIKTQFHENIRRYLGNNIKSKLHIYDNDCFNPDLLLNLRQFAPFNIYFFDGEHTEAAQADAFLKYDHLLADQFICVVDDWNDGNAEQGTVRAFKELNYNILMEVILPSRYNGDVSNYWNGMAAFVIEKAK